MSLFIHLWFRRFISVALLVVLLSGLFAYYNVVYSVCRTPLAYEIADIDSRFNISTKEVRAALSEAESLWEDRTGKNLFTYKEGADLTVHFVFDERQQKTKTAEEQKQELETQAAQQERIRAEYDSIRSKYELLKRAHEKKVSDYDAKLRAYNTDVQSWNEKGGAPSDVYAALEDRKATLDRERVTVNALTENLNTLAQNLNVLSEEGNKDVLVYNNRVANFNTTFGYAEEFTQGDYQKNKISIYQFDSQEELVQVLAHEMGHALGLEHVEDTWALMHHLLEGRSMGSTTISEADLEEYQRVCGTR